MTHFRLPLTVQLAPGESLRWTQRPDVRVRVLSGRIWLTHRGDPSDHFLRAGDSCTLRAAAHSVLGAEEPVCLRIESAASPAWAGWVRACRAAIGRQRERAARAATTADGIIFR